ncbi:hypothetical protein NHX12_000088, partial [Muraenolepis orangiensis]
MNMLTKSAEPECRGPRTNSGQRQPPIRAFMDDLTVMTESVPGCRWILKGLEELVEWARMRFKPAKSRSMVLRKGKVVDKFRFNIADTAIPSISEKLVKSLGKVFDCSLRDTASIQSTCTELDGWLKSVDKSGLPGKFKAWVYQHGILPRILWPLLVYAVPISTVETLERRLIREARENKGNLSVLWLDLENAFRPIPHKLVQFTLTKHHVPSRCRDLIADYYSNFRMRVSSGAITSSWHKVEIGIITGCTISVTLFSLAMNMLTKSAEPECRGTRTNSGQRQPPIRAFMDDLTVMTESVPGCQWILKGLQELVEWARMRFKPAKSRSMVLRKGKVVDKFRFNIADTAIPSISEKLVKSLGKVFDCSLRDTASIQSTCTELDGWLKSVDKSGLPGKFKAWVYQHGILPRILWPLLVYAVPISTVETLERR